MAFGSNHLITGDYGDFIPELWSDDVIAAYKQNLVMVPLVTKINHMGKKGDTIHIPKPSRGSANAKSAETIVTFNNPAETVVNVSINKHYEYSYLIEDILDVQALSSLRRMYTDDAGYALAKQIDQDIMIQCHTLAGGTQYSGAVIGGDGATAWDGTANSNTGNASALTDEGIRRMLQTMDDNDVPFMNRVLVIPPVEKKNLMGIPRYTEQAFKGDGETIKNGLLGNIYGVDIYVTSNCPWVHTDTGDGDDYFDFSSGTATTGTDATGTAVTIGAGGAAVGRVGVLLHKDAIAFAEQMSVRSQTQYKQEYLADLFTADTIYGVAELRDEGGVPFIVAN